MSHRTDIVLLATYWNEDQFINASLAQIEAIDPVEIIICDGCFDPTETNRSTDGTREAIEKFVERRDNARMISAKRPVKPHGLLQIATGHAHSRLRNALSIPRLNVVYNSLRTSSYRLNQALTFNHMISLSEKWEHGRWFMTYDADQFYTDEAIERFELTNEDTDFGLLTADEYTFFRSFDEYTQDYESRTYNNMPHKIYPDTIIRPTRDIMLEGETRRPMSPREGWRHNRYIHHVDTEHIGTYHHYKIPDIDPARYEATYALGDRELPDISEYEMQTFEGRYPSVVEEILL